MADPEIFHEMRMESAEDMAFVHALGTVSLEGLVYDGDPEHGGRPYVGLSAIFAGRETEPLLIALSLNHAAGLIAELRHRVEVMGYGPVLDALIDQHAASIRDFTANEQLFDAVPICAICGAFARRTGTGPAVFDHEPGCANADRENPTH